MDDEIKKCRVLAVQRLKAGESPESICASLGKSKSWRHKWVKRHSEDDPLRFEDRSRKPLSMPRRTPVEIEEIVRLNLYNQNLFCGAQAIRWELEDLGVSPLPSLRTINRILKRNDLTHRRTGKYEPKGTPYPKPPALLPNQTHQMDMVGPCYLTGPIRFYGLNVIDTATAHCGLTPRYPSPDKTFWTEPGQSGRGLESRSTSRLTTPCLSLAVRGTQER